MIGFTRLLCNMGTVSQEISHCADPGRASAAATASPVSELHFSSDLRPLVVWNVTQRCNLACPHCYIDGSGVAAAGELTTEEARDMVDDLAAMGVPVLLFSGGEPLLRRDIFELAARAASKGVRPVLSTNGILITDDVAQRLRDSGFQYAGISIDGIEEYHDRFRAAAGACRRSWEGAERCLEHGVRSGIRFTLTRENAAQLPAVLDETVRRGVPRFCMYHLVYAGRGAALADQDVPAPQKRAIIEWLADRARELGESRAPLEIITTDNHADGIYLWRRLMREGGDGEEVMRLLRHHGGCSAGRKFANVGPTGEVHPCQFWTHMSLGNIRERPFSEIWSDTRGLIGELRNRSQRLGGRCGRCRFQEVCGGCRVRAEAVTGDTWAQDPACYLTEEETTAP
jgi:radical SAM protein with 4Fe4S-binding SPASM domain